MDGMVNSIGIEVQNQRNNIFIKGEKWLVNLTTNLNACGISQVVHENYMNLHSN